MTRACTLERGPQVSLDVVAERLGVTPPALLKRFGNRRALLLAALRPSEDPEWMEFVADGPDARPLEQQMADIMTRLLSLMVREVPRMVALRESGIPLDELFPPGVAPPPVLALRALSGWLDRARERGLIGDDESETAASAIIGALHGRIFLTHLLKRSWMRQPQHEFVETLARMFSRALVPTVKTRKLHQGAPSETARPRHASQLPPGGRR